MLLNCILGVVDVAWAALPGVPEAPRPGLLPGVWAQWSNDCLGGEFGENSDDYRTTAFVGAACIADRILIAADLSTLTLRDQPGIDGRRVDELSLGLGYLLWQDKSAPSMPRLSVGLGMRYEGNFGGQAIQNFWHARINRPPVELDYESEKYMPYVWADFNWLWSKSSPYKALAADFAETGRLGIEFSTSHLYTSEGEHQGAIGLKLLALGRDGSIWFGVREEIRNEETTNLTSLSVARHEEGTWFIYGASAGAIYGQAGIELETNAAIGAVGFAWLRSHNPAGEGFMNLEGAIGGNVNGGGLNARWRWQPDWMQEMGVVGQRSSLYVDYRFGNSPGTTDWHDSTVIAQHGTVGWMTSAFLPRDGWFLNPFIHIGFGVRSEEVTETGPNPRFDEAESVRPAFMTGLGAALTWGRMPTVEGNVQYGLSFGYDYWMPTDSHEITKGSDSYNILTSQGSMTIRLSADTAW